MIVGVAYEGEIAQFELEPRQLLGEWSGPRPDTSASLRGQVRAALASPLGYPPLAKAVVPGDRVVVPTDPSIPCVAEALAALCEVLQESGVEARDITVLSTSGPEPRPDLPPGVRFEVHDPDDRERIAYLATSSTGHRIYLNRLATDADVVVPVGMLAYEGGGQYRGPWSEVFPGLADLRTRQEFAQDDAAWRAQPQTDSGAGALDAAEVGWLLGSHFQVGLIPGAATVAGVVAGHQDEVRRQGVEILDASWVVRPEAQADLVVVGIGVTWKPTTLDDLAAGLETATQLVRVGGKVVVLANLAEVEPGPALRKLAELDDPRQGLQELRAWKRKADYPLARRFVKALGRADIYLSSRLEPAFVEAVGMVPLDDPSDARRLVQRCASCIAVSPAERMRVEILERRDSPELAPERQP